MLAIVPIGTLAIAWALASTAGPLAGPSAAREPDTSSPLSPAGEEAVATDSERTVRKWAETRSVEVGGRPYGVRASHRSVKRYEADRRVMRLVGASVELELTDRDGRVLFSRTGQAFEVVAIEGPRGRGLVVQMMTASDPGMLDAVAELILLAEQGDTLVPLPRTLRIWGGLPERKATTRAVTHLFPACEPGQFRLCSREGPAPAVTRLGPGETLDLVVQGSYFDPVCPATVGWGEGLHLAARLDCRLEGAGGVRSVRAPGTIMLYARPSKGAPSSKLRVTPATRVRPLGLRGRTDTLLDGARRFGDEWLEAEVGGRRGWVYRVKDLELLGFDWIDRC